MPNLERIRIIPLQEKRVYDKIAIDGIKFWVDRKAVTSDLVHIPQGSGTGLAERLQGPVQSFRNSRLGQALERKPQTPTRVKIAS